MQYDFDQVISRRQVNSYKWDVSQEELPMWVADMDFATAPEIAAAVQKRLSQGALGYNIVPDSFFEAYVSWWHRRHNYKIEKDWLLFCTGAVPAVSSIVRKVTVPEDYVLLLSPVYNIFYHSIINNNRQVLESPLCYHEGEYTVDYDDLEEKLSLPQTRLLIFCNPHNPTGKVWSPEALRKIGTLCLKYGVLILSDEVHCDLTHPDYTYTPFAAVAEDIAQITMTCLSPSKAFNIAGLQTSAIMVPNRDLYQQVKRAINTDEVAEPNSFAVQATEAAFNEGEHWLNQLNHYLAENRRYLLEQIRLRFPELHFVSAQATYLAWLDCSAVSQDSKALCDYIRRKTGLILSDGEIFGGNGRQFIRWNYACPKAVLQDGVRRFVQAVQQYKEEAAI